MIELNLSVVPSVLQRALQLPGALSPRDRELLPDALWRQGCVENSWFRRGHQYKMWWQLEWVREQLGWEGQPLACLSYLDSKKWKGLETAPSKAPLTGRGGS